MHLQTEYISIQNKQVQKIKFITHHLISIIQTHSQMEARLMQILRVLISEPIFLKYIQSNIRPTIMPTMTIVISPKASMVP